MKSNGSMNRIFRVVWNATKCVWQAVVEFGKGKSKGGGRRPRLTLAAGSFVLLSASALGADLPSGGNVVAGAGTISQSGNAMTINQSTGKMAIDWQSFNIGQGNSVQFNQPSASSVALNRVLGSDVSVIQGALKANGQVFLINPNGVLFTPTAQVNVGGIVASTLNMKTEDFMAGNYKFEGSSSNAIINQGNITAANGGTIALIAAKISNFGTLTATSGNVLLGAGSKVKLDLGGPVKLVVEQSAIDALIESGGAIRAQGGTVLLTAKAAGDLAASVINHTGLIEAQTLSTGEQGQVTLLADGGTLKISGKIDVSAPTGGAVIPVEATGTLDASLQTSSTLTRNGEPLPSQPMPTAPSELLPVIRPQTPTVARAETLVGGRIVATGTRVLIDDGAHLTASGKNGGGEVLVGGSYQNSDPSVYQATGTIVKAGAKLEANAIDSGKGGTVVAWSDITNPDAVTRFDGNITAKGGAEGGKGGRVETSGATLIVGDNARVNTLAQSAAQGDAGTWLLDPTNFTIAAGSGAQTASGIGATTLQTNLGTGNVSIATSGTVTGAELGDIAVNSALAWSSNKLTLSAHNNITVAAALNGTGTSSLELNANTNNNATPGKINLNADITTGGAQTYNGAVVLGGNRNLTTTNSDISFSKTVNATSSGAQSLTLNQGSGSALFYGAVGGSTALASLNVAGTGTTTVGFGLTGGVTTTGAQTYNGDLRVGATSTTLASTTGGVTVIGAISSYRGLATNQVYSTAGTFAWTAPTDMVGTAELLVVGGGGSGGNAYGANSGGLYTGNSSTRTNGGGGGAGGVYYNGALTLTAGAQYSATVGIGGAGGSDSGQSGGWSGFTPVSGSAFNYTAGGGGKGAGAKEFNGTLTFEQGASGGTACGAVTCTAVGYAGGGGAYYYNSVWSSLSRQGPSTPQYNGAAFYGGGGDASAGGGGGGGGGAGGQGANGGTGNAAGGAAVNFTINTTSYNVASGGGAYAVDTPNNGGGVIGLIGSGGQGARNNSSGSLYGGGPAGAGMVLISYKQSGMTGAGLNINAGSGKVDLRGAIGGNGLTGVAVTSTATDNVISGAIGGTTTLGYTGTAAGALALNAANTTTGSMTVTTGTLKLGDAAALGSGTTTVSSGGALDLNGQSIAKAVTISGTGISSGGALVNSSATAASNSGAVTLAAASSIGGSGNMTLSGAIGGAYALTKAGVGTTTLSATNNYTTTTVNAGTLALTNTGTLGSSTVLTLSGGTLDLQNKALTLSSLAMSGASAITNSSGTGSLAVTGTSTLAGSVTTSGTQTYTGAATLGAATALTTTNSDINFSSTVNGAFGLTLNKGSGKANFNGIVGASTALTSLAVNGSGATYLGGSVTGMTTTGAQSYAGDVYLSAASTSLTTTNSAVSVGGTVYSNVTQTATDAFTTAGSFTWNAPTNVSGNATVLVVGGGGGGGRIYNVGYGFDATGGGGGGGVYYNTAMSVTGGTGYTVKVGTGGASDTTGGYSQFGTITAGGGGAGVSVWSSTPTAATSDLTAICGGTCTAVGYWGGGATAYYNFSSANTYYVGNTSATAATPQFYNGTAWSGTAYKGGTSVANNTGYGGGGGGAGGSGANSSNLNPGGVGGAGVAIAINGTTYKVAAGGGGGYGTGGAVSGVTIGGTTANVTNTSGGNAANGYGSGGGGARRTDNVSYNGGTGSGGVVVVNYTTTGGSGANLTINSGTGKVSMAGASNLGTLAITSSNAANTASGPISGTSSALTYTGTTAGALTLSGTNTYTGATTVASGTLKVGAGGTAGTGTITVGSNGSSTASLDLNGNTLSNALALNGYGVGGSSGAIGALTNSSATAATASGAVTLNSTTYIGGGNITISGAIGGAFGLTKVGTDTLTLAGANTYTGSFTTVNAGTLAVTSTGTLGDITKTLELNNAGVFDLQNKALTMGVLVMNGTSSITNSSGSGSLSVTGTSTLRNSVTTVGTQTYTGAVTLGAATTLNSTNSDISFSSTVNGAQSLTLNQGSGKANFNGIVGGSTALASLNVAGTGATYLGSGVTGITTSGAQNYAGNLYLAAASTSLTSSSNGAITVTGDVVSNLTVATSKVFTALDTSWTAPTNLVGNATLLVVGGGGSGDSAYYFGNGQGRYIGGGGGAGGVYYSTAYSLVGGQSYSVAVGAGGIATEYYPSSGAQSQFGNITAGGGTYASNTLHGAAYQLPTLTTGLTAAGYAGGSGTYTLIATSAVTTAAQVVAVGPQYVSPGVNSGAAFVGGRSTNVNYVGGGAGAAGSGTAGLGVGNGGAGLTFTIGGTTYGVAAGGGGGSGSGGAAGSFAGGAGGTNAAGGTPTAYGSGGGGSYSNVANGTYYSGGSGSAGLVVVGYNASGGSGANLTINSGSGSVSLGKATNVGNVSITSTATTSAVSGVVSGTGNLTYAGTQAGVLTLGAANIYTGTTTVSGGTLKVGAGGTVGVGAVTVGSAASTASLDLNGQTVSNALTLNGYGAGGSTGAIGALTNSNTTTAGTASGAVTLASSTSVGGAGDMTVSGGVGGSQTLTKVGAGKTALTGVNGYGASVVKAGTLQIGGAGNLGGGTYSGAITIDSGAVFKYSSSATQTLSNAISGAGTLVKDTATSTLTLTSATNSYTGATTIDAGTLTIGGAGKLGSGTYAGAISIASGASFKYSSSSQQTLSGVISGAGALTKDTSTPDLILSGANTYSGATTINNGAIRTVNTAALGTSAVTVASGAQLDLASYSIANNITLSGAGGNAFGSLTNSSGNTAIYSGTVTLAAASSIGGAGNITLSGVVSGAFALTKVGAGTITLSGANSYSGGSTVSAGTLQAGSSAAFGTGAVSVTSGALIDLNGQSIANNLTLNGTGISSGGALINSSTTAASTASGTVVLGSASSIGGNNGDITLSGVMSGGFALTKVGGKTVTLSGANTYTGVTSLSGGTLKLGSGTALGTAAASVSSGATLDLNGQSIATVLTILGSGVGGNGALINSSTTAASNSGALVLSMASTVGGSGDMSLSGVVSGTGINLTKVGAGKTALTAANTYSGTTAISGGILEIGGAGNLMAGGYNQTISIASGATLKYSSSATQNLTGVISGAGSVVKDTSNTSMLTLSSGANTYSGGTSILAGTAKSGNGAGFGTGMITVGNSATSTATLDVNGNALTNAMTLNGYGTGGSSGTLGALTSSTSSATLSGNVSFATDTRVGGAQGITLSGTSSGSGKLTKVGTGALTMSGATNTGFTGDVAIVGGTLYIGGTGTFAANNAIDIGSGTSLQYSGSSNGSLNGLISGAAGLSLTTAVTLTLGGSTANTFSGGANISATGGTLKAGKTNAFGTGSSSLNNGNAYDLNGQTLANAFSITGAGISNGGALINSNTTSAATASGNVTVFSHSEDEALIGGAGALNITGKVTASGTHNIVFVGAGSKTLSNASNDIGTIASGASNVGAITVVDASALTVGSAVVSGTTYTGINTNNAAVSLTSSSGLTLSNMVIIGTGALSLTGNTLTSPAMLNGSGALTIQPYTAGTAISLGSATGGLNLSTTILGNFKGSTWSSITLGNASAGNITVGGTNAFNNSPLNVVTAGNITLDAGSSLTSSKASGVIALQAGGNFINNSGSTAVQQTGTNGTWMVYSTAPGSNTFGSLNSQNKAIWGQSVSTLTPTALISAYGNGAGSKGYYIFKDNGTVVVNAGNLTKTYGTDNSASLPGALSYTGTAMTALANVYLANTAADVLTTAPTVASSGSATRAAKGSYDITASGGVAKSGYTVSLGTSGSMTVNPKTLNVVGASSVDKTYDGTTAVTSNGSYTITSADIVSGDSVDVTGATVYDSANASAAGARAVQVGSLALGGTDGGNYTLAFASGSGTINKANLTVKANNDAKFFGQADPNFVTSAGVAYTGLVNGETSGVLVGTLAIARTGTDTAAGTYTGVLNASGLTSSNYNIVYSAGDLTIARAQDLLIKAGNGTATYGSSGSFTPVVQYLSAGTPFTLIRTVGETGSSYSYSDGSGGTVSFTLGATGTTSTSGNLVVGNYSVSGSGYSYTGSNFSGSPVYSGNLAVTPLTATLATTTVSKVYDGTTSANGAASVSNKLGTDAITVSGVGGFGNKNVGTDKAYTMTGLTLAGADAGNYVLAATSVAGTGDITAKTITASYTASDKVYDQSTAATVAGSSSGVINGDTVSFGQTAATFADKNVGTGKTVSISGISLSGTDAGNYNLQNSTANATASITAKALTAGYSGSNKIYDGLTTATVSGSSADIYGGDIVTFSQTANFANKNAGSGKSVSVTGISLTGTDAGNYSLQNTTATTSADITVKNLTASFTGGNKVYDGTVNATLTGGSSDMVSGDNLTFAGSAVFADKNAGTNKTVNVTAIALAGADAGNYSLQNTSATVNADITAKTLNASYAGSNKVYDGAVTATVTGTSADIISGDVVTFSESAAFANKNVGNGKTINVTSIVLGGAAAGNYSLASTTASATGNITPKTLTASYTADNKVYDGTTAASVTGSSADRVGSDVLTYSQTAAFSDKNVGTTKTVNLSGITLGGADAGNYSLSSNLATTNANITAKSLTVSYVGNSKVYDRTTDASVTASSADIVGGDTVTFAQSAAFADWNVGTAKTINVTGITKGGIDAGNYSLGNTTATSAANITPKALTVAYTGSGKVYDAATTATVAASAADVISGDTVNFTQTANFADKNVGAAKAINVTGIALGTGGNEGNYTVSNLTATTSADVTKANLSVTSATAANKVYDGTALASVSGGSVTALGSDVLTLSTNANGMFADKNAANGKAVSTTYTLSGADAGNYNLVQPTGLTANITKAALTVTANNDAKFIGEADPVFATTAGVKYSGFVAGETSSELGGTLAIARTDTATPATAAGTYNVLLPSGLTAANYDISYATGNLTIVGAQELLVKAGNGSATYGSAGSYTPEVQYKSGSTIYTLTQTSVSGNTFSFTDGLTTPGTVTFTLGATGATSASGNLVVGNYNVTGSGYSITGSNFGGTPTYTGNLAVNPLQVSLTTSNVVKGYDGTTLANGTATVSNKQGSDAVTVASTGGAFNSKNVGTSTYTLNGLSLAGADAGNYYLGSTIASGTGSISAKSIITVSYTGQNKVYDGTTTATVTGGSADIISGDVVNFSQTANFTDKNVATGKTINVTGIALASGADIGNYILANTTATATANITAKALTASYTGTNKVYDRTTTATVSGSSSDMVSGDTLTYSQTATFDNKNVATGKAVSISSITLGGLDAGNYSLQNTTATTTANVTAKSLTASYTAAGKTYDGSTSVSVTGASTDIISGDTVNFSQTAALVDKNAGAAKVVNVTAIGISGTDAGNYSLQNADATTTANVAKATLSAISGMTAGNKVYDGSTSATLSTGSAVFSGMATGDNLSVASATGAFANKNAGTGKTVTISGIGLTGADVGNYNVFTGTSTALADITQRALTATWTGTNKVYDGTTAATVSNSDNRISGDVLTVSNSGATFANKNAGTGKLISVTGVSLSGTDAGNYSISNTGTASADVTAKTVGLALNGTASRTYDGTTAFNLVGLTASATGTVDGDTVTVGVGDVTGVTDKNAGINKIVTFTGFTLGGADAGNYNLVSGSAASNASITKAALTVTANAVTKTYDSTLTATGAGTVGTIAGAGAGESVLAAGSQAFLDKNAGISNKTVRASGVTIKDSGNVDVSSNYNITYSDNYTSTINKADLSVTGLSASDKTYNTNTAATLTGTAVITALTGDTVTLGGAAVGAFADKNVANGKSVTVTGNTISGTDAGNYNLLQQTGLTANISKADLSVTGLTASNKVYNANTAATLTGTAAITALTGDTVTLGGAAVGAFADKNAANGKAVTVTGNTISGIDAGNYNLLQQTGLTANISKADLSVTGLTASNKTYDTTTVATLAGTAAVTALTGDSVTLGGTASGAFADKLAANGKAVTVTGVTLISGGDNYNLLQQTGLTANISKADITAVTGITAANKVYDTLTSATLTTTGAGFTGRLGADVLNVATATGNFIDKTAATGKTVNITGITLGGDDAGNYNLTTTTASTTADISKADLSVTGLTASNKVYDGQTTAVVTTTTANLNGKLGSDDLTITVLTGNFADKNVGTGKTVSITGITLGGTDAGNYNLTNTSASANADITRLNSVAWIGGTTGNWFEPANWAGGAVPDLSNVANVQIPSNVVVSFNNTVTAPAQAGTVNVDSIGTQGGLTVSSGILSVANSLQLANYVQSGGAVSTGGNFTITNSFNQTSGSIVAAGNVGITQITGGTTLGNVTAGGVLGVTATGDIEQATNTSIAVTGLATLISTNGNISLGSATNDFGTVNATGGNISLADTTGMTVALTASGNSTLNAGGNLAVSGSTQNLTTATGTGTTSFGNTSVAGNLVSTSAGAISQTGPLSVTGTAGFSAAGQNVTLNNPANDFGGTVFGTANNLSLADANGLSLGVVTTSGNLTASAGNRLDLGTSSVGGNLLASSANGSITQTGVLQVAGISELSATNGGVNLSNPGNNFGGAITANSPSNNLSGTGVPVPPSATASASTTDPAQAAITSAQQLASNMSLVNSPSSSFSTLAELFANGLTSTSSAASPLVESSQPSGSTGSPSTLAIGGFEVVQISSEQLMQKSADANTGEAVGTLVASLAQAGASNSGSKPIFVIDGGIRLPFAETADKKKTSINTQ